MARKLSQPSFITAKKSYDTKESSKLFAKLDYAQLRFYESIQDNLVTFCDSCAGSGKTTIVFLAGLQMLDSGTIDRIVYIRLPNARSLSQGYLPGTQEEKQSVLMGAAWDALETLGIQNVESMIDEGALVLTSDLGLRGVNLQNSCVILDEMQDADIPDLQLILTRVHDSCKVIVCGHSDQRDNKPKLYHGLSAFQLYSMHYSKKPFANSVTLSINYRGKVSQWSDEIHDTLDELRPQSKLMKYALYRCLSKIYRRITGRN